MAQQCIKKGENDGPVFVLIPKSLRGRRTFWWLGMILGGIIGFLTGDLLFENIIFGIGFGLAIGITLGWGIAVPVRNRDAVSVPEEKEYMGKG